MIINYAREEDKISAELLQKKVGGKIVFSSTPLNINTITEEIIVVGNQDTNPTYGEYINAGTLVRMKDDIYGYILTGSHLGHNVYAVGGITREGIIGAVYYLFSTGFPLETNNIQVSGLKSSNIYTIPLINDSNFLNFVQDKTNTIIEKANEKLIPKGYHIGYAQLSRNQFSIIVNEFGSDLSWGDILVIVLGAILIVLGFFTPLGWAGFIFGGIFIAAPYVTEILTSGSPEKVYKSQKDATDSTKELVTVLEELGFTPDQITRILETMSKNATISTTDKILSFVQTALLVGGLGVGGYYVTKNLILPTLKSKS